MPSDTIQSLFASDISRRIEEVIKVDQTDGEILRDEIKEYVVTDSIRDHYEHILDVYRETPNKPHEGIAVWVSGFFGSGKSSFAKMLGLAIENRDVVGERAASRFAQKVKNGPKVHALLAAINEHIPTHAVIFDVSTDRGIRSGNQTLTEIMYGLFLQSLGYAKDLDLSELEIALEEKGELARFEAEYQRLFAGKKWDVEKGKIAFALNQASRVMHSLDPATYPTADSWVKASQNRSDITPGKLAERANLLMKRRGKTPDGRVKALLFVIDEVGQFVARDVQKMLDLQAVVQSLGVKGRGRHWVVVTSQERLGELVSGLDDKKIELARLMDRFPLQVHLESSDIAEVTSRRVLSKNAAAEATLGRLFDEHRGRLAQHTHMTADFKLPELTRAGFVDLYPLLPYQIELIIQIVSGLRTQGGGSKHVGGANRTIIKLAQQLLINPAVHLADEAVGNLVRLDQVYDLVENNIGSDVRAKIASVKTQLNHPLAQSVAKAICLLQYVKSVPRTAENLAVALHPGVASDSQLAEVKAALEELEAAHKVRRGEGGYRIPTPAEDDWERQRNGINPKPSDTNRLHAEALTAFWQPLPSHTLLDARVFKAGLYTHGSLSVEGDLLFHVQLAEDGKDFKALADELRTRSQVERKTVFWAVALQDAVDREGVELYRSRKMLEKRGREAPTADERSLLEEERGREKRHQDELRRLLRTACLAGSVYFRGNDRSPNDRAVDVGKTAAEILAQVLPEVFDRFGEAAARAAELKKGADALFSAENLRGLPPVFGALNLLRDEKGKAVFRVESGALAEVLARIEERAAYGDTATGRSLTDEFAKEPFGWDFDAVRLFALALVRAGKIEATSKGQTFDTLTTIEARDALSNNNNLFRQASFRPKKGIEFEELIQAAEAFRDTFGSEVRELNAGAIAAELRAQVARHEDALAQTHGVLAAHRLPGGAVLDKAVGQMKAILRGSDESAIGGFNASHRVLKDAIKRASELEQSLTEPRLRDLEAARQVVTVAWPFLQHEPDVPDALRARAAALEDLLQRETFYRDLPTIEQHATALRREYETRHAEALRARNDAYASALDELTQTPGWGDLGDERRRTIAAKLQVDRGRGSSQSVPELRAELDACEGRLRSAVAEVRRVLDGERLVTVSLGSYFGAGVETEEQLEAALTGIREECARLIGAGKKVVVR